MTPEELKNIAPTLANLQNKKTGFIVPATYFDNLESSITDEIGSKNLPNDPGLAIPDDYFNSIEEKVFSRLHEKINIEKSTPETKFESFEDIVITPVKKEKKQPFVNTKKYLIPLAVAASIALFIGIIKPFTIYSKSDVSEITLWIEDGNLDLDSYEIAEYFNSDIESLDIENTINTESLENYLLDEVTEDSFYN